MKDDVQDSQNKTFAQQRRALHAILDEGEQKVPSTTANIMAAIRQEQRTSQKAPVGANNNFRVKTPIAPFPQVHEIETPRPRPKRTRRTLYSALALTAVAAVLVASFGLFSSISLHNSASVSSGSSAMRGPATMMTKFPPFVPSTVAAWSSVILTYTLQSATIISNYDPVSGKSTILATSHSTNTSVDGVSHDGQKVLYSVYNGTNMLYYLYSRAAAAVLYTTSERRSSAIWSTDDRYVFINTPKGIAQVDVQTHRVKLILPALASTLLLNYRDGYLYFVKGYKSQAHIPEGTFNRVNIATGEIQQITLCEQGANFWLSPGGITVYYTCLNQYAAVYAVHSDGTNPHIFRSDTSKMIGYADDGSPLTTIADAGGKYQVVQRDLSSSQRDKVLLRDVAPGATTIPADTIAVAPFGHVLVAKGMYGGNDSTKEERLWYGDLVAGTSQPLYLPQGARTPHAIGWDTLHVPGDMLTP